MARNLELNQQIDLAESVNLPSLGSLNLTLHDQSDLSKNSNKKRDLSTVIANLTKDLRCSFTNGMSNVCESYVSNRLKAKFRNIARIGRKEEGQSAFLFSKFGHALNGFEFNSDHPYHDIFKAKYFIKQGSNRGHLILHFPAFIPNEKLNAPKEATHFKLYNQLVALSDFEFDSETGYRPVSKKFHGKKSEFYSQMLPILKIPVQPITSQLSVNNGMGVPDSSGLLLIMGIHFYRYHNSKFVPMPKDSALEIVKTF